MEKIYKYPIWEEIKDQNVVINSTVEKFLSIKKELKKYCEDYEKLFFVGCGSSYHVGIIGSFLHNFLLNKVSYAVSSSDFIIFTKSYVNKKSNSYKYLLLSRTGHTTETVTASEILKQNHSDFISLTTLADGDLLKNLKYSIILDKLKEESVPATKSVIGFTVFILCLIFLLANKLNFLESLIDNSNIFYGRFYDYVNTIEKIILKNNFKKFVFLGNGPYYGVSREAELKVKEMSLSNTEAFQILEYRHGHKAIINSNTLIIYFISDQGINYELRAAKELKKLGAKTLVIGNCIRKLKSSYDYLIDVDLEAGDISKVVFYQLFGQLIGYFQAIKKGINPTNPKNLDYFVVL